jgi:proline iminopeptidase
MPRLSPRPLRELYPALEPYRSGTLKVDATHEIYFEECGQPDGKPALFVHGGPGGGSDPVHRRFWNPERYRIVLFDQRGCGRSRPHACLEDNTTWHLVDDMEQLRAHLGIDRWQVFGGSWGSTLALAYAQSHPERCSELVLRGIFLVRQEELRWYYRDGANRIFPDAWEHFVAPIPAAERGDLIAAYYKRLTSEVEEERAEAAHAWSVWEGSTSRLIADPALIARSGEGRFADALARIECHYFMNRGFLERDGQLLENIEAVRSIPAVIVQGRYDMVTAPASAWALHRAWPEAQLRMIPDAGHSALEPGILSALIKATDEFGRTKS